MFPPSATVLQVDQYFEKYLFVVATTPKIVRFVFPVCFVEVLSPIAIFYFILLYIVCTDGELSKGISEITQGIPPTFAHI
jgi:hypothetical protein